MILSWLLQLGVFLLLHFNVTNSLLAGILVQLLTINQEWSSGVRWLLFIGVVVVCLVIQRVFLIGRIVFAVFSVLVAGILAYGWVNYDTRSAQLMACAIWMVVVGVLNIFSCSMNKAEA